MEDKILRDCYIYKYESNIPDLKLPNPEEVSITLQNPQQYSLPQLLYIKSRYESYLADVDLRITKLDASRTTVTTNIADIEYLLLWFDLYFGGSTMLNADEYSDEDKEENSSNPGMVDELRRWFVKYGDPKLFEYTEGSYDAKRSIHMYIYYTKWLYDQNLHCHNYEGDREWKYKYDWASRDTYNSKSSWKLSEMLNPLSLEELLKQFNLIDKSLNNNDFMLELMKFLHCMVLDSRPEFDEGPYIHLDEDCCEFDY